MYVLQSEANSFRLSILQENLNYSKYQGDHISRRKAYRHTDANNLLDFGLKGDEYIELNKNDIDTTTKSANATYNQFLIEPASPTLRARMVPSGSTRDTG